MLRRILSVFGANIFGQVITILIQVISVPVFLHFWGASLYGEWLIVTALPSYLIVSGSGIGYVAGNTMQKHISSQQEKEALAVFQSAWLVTLGLSLLLLLIIVPAVLFFPVFKWMNIVHASHQEISATMLLFTGYVLLSLQTELFTGVYRANEKFGRAIMAGNILRLIEFAGTIILIILGSKFLMVSIALFLIRVLGIGWMLYDLRTLCWAKLGFRHSGKTLIKSELQATISFLGFPLGHACLIQGMTTVIGIQMGPGAVVVFSVVRTLTGFIKQFSSAIYYSVWPELTRSLSTGDLNLAKGIHRHAFQITFLFTVLSGFGIYIFGEWIFRIWTGNNLSLDKNFLLLMLLSTIPNTLWMMSSYVSISINKHSPIAMFYAIFSILSLIICYLLLPAIGLLAVPLSTLFCDVCTMCFVVNRSFNIVQDKWREFIAYVFSPLSFRQILKFKHL